MKCSQQVPKGLQLYSHCPFPPSRAGVKMYVFIRWVSTQFCILEHEVETVWCATFQSKAFVFSLLLLQCLVENVILKLLLYICQCHKDVLIFPKVCPCAGTKWLFSLYYVPLPQYVMLHLMSTSQMTRKLFHIQSPTESIADKLSHFLILRPTPSGGRLQLQSVAVSLVQGGHVNQSSTAFTCLWEAALILVSFPLVAGTAVLMFLQAAEQWWQVIMWATWSCSALLVKRFVWLHAASPLRESSWLTCFPTLQGPWKEEQVSCSSGDESTHCLGGEKSSTFAIH